HVEALGTQSVLVAATRRTTTKRTVYSSRPGRSTIMKTTRAGAPHRPPRRLAPLPTARHIGQPVRVDLRFSVLVPLHPGVLPPRAENCHRGRLAIPSNDFPISIRKRSMRRSFWRCLLGRLRSTSRAKRAARFRPGVESLEGLVLLSGVRFLPTHLLSAHPL